MRAGFSRACITPALGTPMIGWTRRDREHGCTGVHDDLFARVLFIEHESEAALLVGSTWPSWGGTMPTASRAQSAATSTSLPGRSSSTPPTPTTGPPSAPGASNSTAAGTGLLRRLEGAVVAAAREAEALMEGVTLQVGMARSSVPMSRRRPGPDGAIGFAPNPEGVVCDALPVCQFSGAGDGRSVSSSRSPAIPPASSPSRSPRLPGGGSRSPGGAPGRARRALPPGMRGRREGERARGGR